jgi:hypothetical protein
MKPLKFFLEIRVIQDIDLKTSSIYLVQDAYIAKLVKNYQINTNLKASPTPLPFSENDMQPYQEDVDPKRVHTYRQKVRSVCYPAIITRPDIAKSASKLTEHLINPEPDHIAAVNHCIRYLYETKHLEIKFNASKDEELTNSAKSKHVFEASVDASFANEEGRRSAEGYTFKLFEGLID